MASKLRLNAIVDYLAPAIGGGHWYRVQVWEALPGVNRRIWRIRASSDNMAAEEGLRRLTDELERPLPTVH